jgi:hypothetical protein
MASDQVPNFKMLRSTQFPVSGGCEKNDQSGHSYFALVGFVNINADTVQHVPYDLDWN